MIDCTVHKASEEILLAILKLEPSLSFSVMSVSMSGDVPVVELWSMVLQKTMDVNFPELKGWQIFGASSGFYSARFSFMRSSDDCQYFP